MRGRRRISLTAAVAATAIAVAGCGSEDDQAEGGGSLTVQTSEGVEVAGGEYFFDPATVTAEGAGSLEITFINEGSLAHNLTVFQGEEEIAATETFAGGEQETITADLEPGAYEMICTVADHEALGMVGEIEVTE